MKKKWIYSAVVLSSVGVLSACGTANEKETDTAVTSSAVVESSDQKTAYQNMYRDSQDLYGDEKYDEAAGNIDMLLQNDLTDYPDLKADAEALKEKITTAQTEETVQDDTYDLMEKSDYKAERKSVITGEAFTKETGKNIKMASDKEIKQWITKQETAAAHTEVENTQVNKASEESKESKESKESAVDQKQDTAEKTETESSQKDNPADKKDSSTASSASTSTQEETMTLEEEQNYVLDKVVEKTGISPSDNQFFATKENETTYQIEIRHAHEVDGVEISNMVGMFKYDLSSDSLTKMDPVSGKYETYTPIH